MTIFSDGRNINVIKLVSRRTRAAIGVSRLEQRPVVRLSHGEGVGDGVTERPHRPTQDAAAAPPP